MNWPKSLHRHLAKVRVDLMHSELPPPLGGLWADVAVGPIAVPPVEEITQRRLGGIKEGARIGVCRSLTSSALASRLVPLKLE
jgi:hypothetical protein